MVIYNIIAEAQLKCGCWIYKTDGEISIYKKRCKKHQKHKCN